MLRSVVAPLYGGSVGDVAPPFRVATLTLLRRRRCATFIVEKVIGFEVGETFTQLCELSFGPCRF